MREQVLKLLPRGSELVTRPGIAHYGEQAVVIAVLRMGIVDFEASGRTVDDALHGLLRVLQAAPAFTAAPRPGAPRPNELAACRARPTASAQAHQARRDGSVPQRTHPLPPVIDRTYAKPKPTTQSQYRKPSPPWKASQRKDNLDAIWTEFRHPDPRQRPSGQSINAAQGGAPGQGKRRSTDRG